MLLLDQSLGLFLFIRVSLESWRRSCLNCGECHFSSGMLSGPTLVFFFVLSRDWSNSSIVKGEVFIGRVPSTIRCDNDIIWHLSQKMNDIKYIFEIKCNISTDYKMLFWHAFCSSSLFHSCTKNYWQQTPNHVRIWKIGILSTIILNNLGEFAYRTPFLKVTKSLNVNSATHKWIFEYFLAGRKARIILKLFLLMDM